MLGSLVRHDIDIAFWPLSYGLPSIKDLVRSLALAAALWPRADPAPALLPPKGDLCVPIANQTWVTPSQVRQCFGSFSFNTTLRNNLVDVVSKTLNFHTSVTYSLKQPAPFDEINVDIQAELARIRKSTYSSDFALHQDLSRTVKLLKDGHAGYINYCYDSLFVTYLPFPVVPLGQDIYIAPEAYDIAVSTFGADEVAKWEKLAGIKFSKYSGAKIILLDGRDPWKAVDDNAAVTGSYETHATRQNRFFSSYQAGTWTYRMGDFASQSLPIKDSVTLIVQPTGQLLPEVITVPYRSRFGSSSIPFTDSKSLWANNCVARSDTNGASYYAPPSIQEADDEPPRPRFQEPVTPIVNGRRVPVSAIVEDGPTTDIDLPTRLQPSLPLVNGTGAMKFYLLDDNVTGVLALGSFSGDYSGLFSGLPAGLAALKAKGATRLLVDVSNNGGGYICVASWLHRLLAGPNPGTIPQPGFDTKVRVNDLNQAIVKKIISTGIDTEYEMLYNPEQHAYANSTGYFPAGYDWLDPPVTTTINGRVDKFSQKLGNDCNPFSLEPPAEKYFDLANIAILGTGSCASSCSIFSINMVAHYGIKSVVYGGKPGVQQQYAGIVGGQSINYVTVDSEIKTVDLKQHALAPPDFITDSYQGITFRLGFSIKNPAQMEEFTSHPAQFQIPLTTKTVNNPVALWKDVASKVFKK
ncbi:hypothetical protein BOTBODRAFT_37753 [Botryobasidium botryosum FD-172 SS1]|uniref:Tail specific protease domain-containing protein n=1 Tax=Botryobasidium botryosum (strain FD-172 SS1) TaxID=930990 RepID=A0A067M1L5_BOTB1|nr:hypothetical protein BOTBODRAFT_37753 [Botryobasidium botryosum FD-172 SS1]